MIGATTFYIITDVLIHNILLPYVSLQAILEPDDWLRLFLSLSYKRDQSMIQNVLRDDVEEVSCQTG